MSSFRIHTTRLCSERRGRQALSSALPSPALRKLCRLFLSLAAAWLLVVGLAAAAPMRLNGISEKYTFTNNSGMVANDLELTFKQTISAASTATPFPSNSLSKDKKTITFSGDTVDKNGGKATAIVNFPNAKQAELTKAQWSFPNNKGKKVDNVEIPNADIRLGMINNGTDGALVSLTNDESTANVFITGFALATNVPGSLFVDSPAGLAGLAANNMYFSQGTPVTSDPVTGMSIPSTFELTPGQGVTFNLGSVNPQDYIELTYTSDFSWTPSPYAIQVTAADSPTSTPEPSTIILLGTGTFGLLGYVRWRRARPG